MLFLTTQNIPASGTIFRHQRQLVARLIMVSMPLVPGIAVRMGWGPWHWQVLYHLTIHGVDQRSHVSRLIYDANGVIFAQDMIVYLWQRIIYKIGIELME